MKFAEKENNKCIFQYYKRNLPATRKEVVRYIHLEFVLL